MKFELHISGKTRIVEMSRENGHWQFLLDGIRIAADAVEVAPGSYSVLMGGESHEVRVAPLPDGRVTLHTGSMEYTAEVVDPRAWRGRKHGAMEAEGRQPVTAPMPGKVVRLLVRKATRWRLGKDSSSSKR